MKRLLITAALTAAASVLLAPPAGASEPGVTAAAYGGAEVGQRRVWLQATQGGFCVHVVDHTTWEAHHGCSGAGGTSDGLTTASAQGTVTWHVPERTTTTKRGRTETVPAKTGTLAVDVRWHADGLPQLRDESWSSGGCLLLMYDCSYYSWYSWTAGSRARVVGTVVDSEWGTLAVDGFGEVGTTAGVGVAVGRL